MDRCDILAALAAQAVDEGAEPLTIRAIIEDSAELGAQRALARLGLSDGAAQRDIVDLRQLVISWRDVQTTARRAIVRWLTTLLLSLLVLGVFVYSDLPQIKP